MAYVKPKIWVHGDIPTAADMNVLRLNLDDINGQEGDFEVNPVSPVYMGEDEDSGEWWLVHTHRFLWYGDEAVMEDVFDPSSSTSLAKPEDGVAKFDLETVKWLKYGMTYKITGCAWVIEGTDA